MAESNNKHTALTFMRSKGWTSIPTHGASLWRSSQGGPALSFSEALKESGYTQGTNGDYSVAESNNRTPYTFLRGLGWIKRRSTISTEATWHAREGAPGMSFDEALKATGYQARTAEELAHLAREHMKTADKPCGYTTPPVGEQCRKCGCKIGETKADDVLYVREADRPPAERAYSQLVVLNRNLTSLMAAFNDRMPVIADFLESVKGTGQTTAEGASTTQEPRQPSGTQNALILEHIDTALVAINRAGALLDSASTSTAKMAHAATLLRAVQTTVRRRKAK